MAANYLQKLSAIVYGCIIKFKKIQIAINMSDNIAVRSLRSVGQGLYARIQSAGGLYNFGNVLDLYAVAASALLIHPPHSVSDVLSVVGTQLVGDPAAASITVAATGFLVAGEYYHQAWKNGWPPHKLKNFAGDFLSGVSALALGYGLYHLGQPVLAMASGGLHAFSKFGSSLNISERLSAPLNIQFKIAGYTTTGMDIIKDCALLSRVPALALCAQQTINNFVTQPADQAMANSLMPILLGWCYIVWSQADNMLMQDSSLLKQMYKRTSAAIDAKIQSSKTPVRAAEIVMKLFDLQNPRHTAEELNDPESLKRASRKSMDFLVSFTAFYSIILANVLAPKEIIQQMWPLTIPLGGKMIYELAKVMARTASSRDQLVALQKPSSLPGRSPG